MICYRDMSFCDSDCVNAECPRHFGEKEQIGAKQWWSTLGADGEAPIAFCDFSKDCGDYMKEQRNG